MDELVAVGVDLVSPTVGFKFFHKQSVIVEDLTAELRKLLNFVNKTRPCWVLFECENNIWGVTEHISAEQTVWNNQFQFIGIRYTEKEIVPSYFIQQQPIRRLRRI